MNTPGAPNHERVPRFGVDGQISTSPAGEGVRAPRDPRALT
jgi:hypothetical protein